VPVKHPGATHACASIARRGLPSSNQVANRRYEGNWRRLAPGSPGGWSPVLVPQVRVRRLDANQGQLISAYRCLCRRLKPAPIPKTDRLPRASALA